MELNTRLKTNLYHMGLDKWHNLGYTAKEKGITVWNWEEVGDVHSNTSTTSVVVTGGYEEMDDINTSTVNTVSEGDGYISIHIIDKLPNGEVIHYEGLDAMEKYIVDNNIDIITYSMSTSKTSGNDDYWSDLVERLDVVICNSAGNDGGTYEIDTSGTGGFGMENTFSVGALRYDEGDEKYIKMSYSETGEVVDFITFAVTKYGSNGTSFSSPALAGQIATIMSICGKMKQQHIKEFLIAISKDLGIEGKEWMHGYGFPVMPDPDDGWVQFDVDDKLFEDNGNAKIIDQFATIDEITSRTLVPVRYLTEGLNCEVGWDNITRQVIIDDLMLGHKIVLTIDSDIMIVDGEEVQLDQPAKIINDRTMLPARAVVEAIEGVIAWSDYEKKVTCFRLKHNHNENKCTVD